MAKDFQNTDYWKAIILYGLNNATYKIALGKTLIELSSQKDSKVKWATLLENFLDKYVDRLKKIIFLSKPIQSEGP